jgi:lipoprotein-anchoring transpeptidase ErfK/SrfK
VVISKTGVKVMRATTSLKTASLLVISILAGARPASAQWTYYQGYQSAPPPYAGQPAYPAYPVPPAPYDGSGYYGEGNAYPAGPPRTRPYARQAPQQDYDQGYDQGYGATPYRQPGHANLEPSDPGTSEANIDTSQKTAQMVPNPTHEPAGTIVIDTRSKHLYLVQADGQAMQYGIGVGRQGFEWKGEAEVHNKQEWPAWYPPKEMLKRRPDLPEHMEGGIDNPLGARALYLYQGNKDTLFRIHGTNEPDTIGKAVSSGCIRMMNADVIDLYKRVPVGTRVVVL